MDQSGAINGCSRPMPPQMGTSIELILFHQRCAISQTGASMAALLGHDLYFMCILVLKQTGFLLEFIDRLKVMEPKDQLR